TVERQLRPQRVRADEERLELDLEDRLQRRQSRADRLAVTGQTFVRLQSQQDRRGGHPRAAGPARRLRQRNAYQCRVKLGDLHGKLLQSNDTWKYLRRMIRMRVRLG